MRQKFLVNTRFDNTEILPMTVVLNWPVAVKREHTGIYAPLTGALRYLRG